MEMGFWKTLHRPIAALAPMANVTDAAFRRVIARYGKPDVMWTEFVSCDGLCSEGKDRLLPDLWFSSAERPIVAQIFGARPEFFYRTALVVRNLGFDGIDINMGCPDRAVEKQGAGAALMRNPARAREIIRQTRRGAGPLPVSVKTRIGYASPALSQWLPHLLDEGLAAITIHARTRSEMSDVPAHWDAVAEAVQIRNAGGFETLILGNGDVGSIEEVDLRVTETGADGCMIGRGVLGNPWFFNRARKVQPSPEERIHALIGHARLFEELFSGKKSYAVMKKHIKAYISGFDGAHALREAFMAADTPAEMERVAKQCRRV